jgi:hypothetical protein
MNEETVDTISAISADISACADVIVGMLVARR